MKKYLFLPILLIFMSCTSLNASTTVTETIKISNEITTVIEELKEVASLNEYDKLENFFLPTLKNKYVVKQLKQYNLSNLTLVFSEIDVISKDKAKGTMVVNYGSESNYFKITWKISNDGSWKIADVVEKK